MNKLEQAAREVIRQHSMECLSDKTVDALREALDQDIDCPCGNECIKCSPRVLLAEQAEQEPVAVIKDSLTTELLSDALKSILEMDVKGHQLQDRLQFSLSGRELLRKANRALYAAPVRTKDLTDDEIAMCMGKDLWNVYKNEVDFARAVIAADREKNK